MEQELLQWISASGRLLGALFYYAPQDERTQPMFEFFKQPNWIEEWVVDIKEINTIQANISTGLNQNLDEAYQALFIGPNALPAPPWGSVYLDKESVIFGESLLALRQFLALHQIDLSKTQNEPEDHLGLLLMLSAFLAENKPDLLNEFLSTHFLPWAYRCLALLSEQTQYPFYAGLAQLASETLKDWQQEANIQPVQTTLYH